MEVRVLLVGGKKYHLRALQLHGENLFPGDLCRKLFHIRI